MEAFWIRDLANSLALAFTLMALSLLPAMGFLAIRGHVTAHRNTPFGGRAGLHRPPRAGLTMLREGPNAVCPDLIRLASLARVLI